MRTHGNPGNEGPAHETVHHGEGPYGHSPYWRRAHHDWRFWTGLSLMLLAITVYVLSDDLAFLPHPGPREPASRAVGK